MVMPIRINAMPCNSTTVPEGMYVVGKSNASNPDIPHLPVIEVAAAGTGKNEYQVVGYGNDKPIGVMLCDSLLDSFSEGDVVRFDPLHGMLYGVLTKKSNSNTLLVTEQCENLCVFCSQPPRTIDDNVLYHQAALAILNFDSSDFVGISGGESTHNRRAFLSLLKTLNVFGNKSKLHILSNGRSLGDPVFAQDVMRELQGRVVMWGVPLYGHKEELHDELVCGHHAFIETINGLSNLSYYQQIVELRVIPVKKNVFAISRIVEFIVSNYLTIKTISIMNLEPKGLARKNFHDLHVPVEEQLSYLDEAVQVGERYGCVVRLFNYPLCSLNDYLRIRAVKSISDWKNYYPDECDGCILMSKCGGMFASATGRFQEKIRRIE